MTFNNTEFEVKEWEVDKSFFSSQNELLFKSEGDLAWGLNIRVNKKLPAGFVGILWMYEILDFKKSRLKYHVFDNYMANFEGRNNDEKDIKETISASYNKARAEFNRLKNEVGLVDFMPVLQIDHLNAVYQNIVNGLKEKGV